MLGGGSGVGSLLGGIGGLIGNQMIKGGDEYYKKALEAIMQTYDPQFNYDPVKAAQLQEAVAMQPASYEAVTPAEYQGAADSPEMRGQQLQALAQWKQQAQEGLPLDQRLAAEEAQNATRQAYRQAVEGSIRGLQRRGQAGGGQEAVARMGAAAQSANMARGQGNDLMRQAIANKIQGLQQYGNMAGQVRQQDYGIRADQANSYNNFKRWLAEYQTAPRADNAQWQNQANAWNAQQRQGRSDYNAQNRQRTQETNQDRFNSLQGQYANWDLGKRGLMMGQYNTLGYNKDADKAAQIQNIVGIGQGIGGIAGSFGSFGG